MRHISKDVNHYRWCDKGDSSAVFDTTMYHNRDLTMSIDTAGPVLILWHVCSSGPHLI